jgi:hypothetical protein
MTSVVSAFSAFRGLCQRPGVDRTTLGAHCLQYLNRPHACDVVDIKCAHCQAWIPVKETDLSDEEVEIVVNRDEVYLCSACFAPVCAATAAAAAASAAAAIKATPSTTAAATSAQAAPAAPAAATSAQAAQAAPAGTSRMEMDLPEGKLQSSGARKRKVDEIAPADSGRIPKRAKTEVAAVAIAGTDKVQQPAAKVATSAPAAAAARVTTAAKKLPPPAALKPQPLPKYSETGLQGLSATQIHALVLKTAKQSAAAERHDAKRLAVASAADEVKKRIAAVSVESKRAPAGKTVSNGSGSEGRRGPAGKTTNPGSGAGSGASDPSGARPMASAIVPQRAAAMTAEERDRRRKLLEKLEAEKDSKFIAEQRVWLQSAARPYSYAARIDMVKGVIFDKLHRARGTKDDSIKRKHLMLLAARQMRNLIEAFDLVMHRDKEPAWLEINKIIKSAATNFSTFKFTWDMYEDVLKKLRDQVSTWERLSGAARKQQGEADAAAEKARKRAVEKAKRDVERKAEKLQKARAKLKEAEKEEDAEQQEGDEEIDIVGNVTPKEDDEEESQEETPEERAERKRRRKERKEARRAAKEAAVASESVGVVVAT